MQITGDILECCVLASLSESDLYGYALTQKIQAKIAISESTLYPVLRRLKAKKLLSTYDESYQGRNRRYYKITEAGLKELGLYREKWQSFKATINSFLEEGTNE